MTASFALRPSLDLSLTSIGQEGEKLLSVERLMEEPEALVDFAATEVSFAQVDGPQGGYPGVRAPAPLDYVGAVVRRLSPAIERAFGLQGVKLGRAECSFSIVTRHPIELAPLQRVPHVDTTDDLQFALLHYLCGPEKGGTAFYRHRATGYEIITPERQQHFQAVRDREIAEGSEPSGYITGDNAHYEQLASVDAAFDRVVVYRSRILHSGQIPPDLPLLSDPRRGRLTANIFISYRPA
ncbi:DUF6445 family protein [Sphingomonas sp. LHG3406-1]|uniref:DUF6445 family protein n=1 Tax=Sphingomonas sp. LHG3406-1 TaxID=2804617 RepID=UPI002607CF20|nr:DUF6445 family protein [Sphingomonas sp. LHG3406-1]